MSFDVVLRNPGSGFNVSLTTATSPSEDGYFKVWTGAAFELKPVKVWSGADWLIKPVKRWTGAVWEIIHSGIAGVNASLSATLDSIELSSDADFTSGARTTPVLRSSYSILDNLTVSKPAGTVEGDLMLLMVTDFGLARTINPPAGWSSVASQLSHGGDLNLMVFYKLAGPSEPSSYSTTIDSGSDYPASIIASFYNVDSSDPISNTATAVSSGTSASSLASVTAEYSNSMLIGAIHGYSGLTDTPAGTSMIAQEFSSQMSYQAPISVGATGTKSTGVDNDLWASLVFIINGAP